MVGLPAGLPTSSQGPPAQLMAFSIRLVKGPGAGPGAARGQGRAPRRSTRSDAAPGVERRQLGQAGEVEGFELLAVLFENRGTG